MSTYQVECPICHRVKPVLGSRFSSIWSGSYGSGACKENGCYAVMKPFLDDASVLTRHLIKIVWRDTFTREKTYHLAQYLTRTPAPLRWVAGTTLLPSGRRLFEFEDNPPHEPASRLPEGAEMISVEFKTTADLTDPWERQQSGQE